jgi:hypothetical protein
MKKRTAGEKTMRSFSHALSGLVSVGGGAGLEKVRGPKKTAHLPRKPLVGLEQLGLASRMWGISGKRWQGH